MNRNIKFIDAIIKHDEESVKKLIMARGVEFFPLEDWAQELLKRPREILVASVIQGRLPGRAGTVSRQEVLEAAA